MGESAYSKQGDGIQLTVSLLSQSMGAEGESESERPNAHKA
ncbi:UNVERIFIED_CONTAM: hypothetical protein ABIC26_004756 [Paenibacillus sp. PvR008]